VRVREYTNDVPATLGAQTNQTITSGDGHGIECIGTTIGVYFNNNAAGWTQLQTQSDSSITTSGRIGHQQNATQNVTDDFFGGTVVGGAAPTEFFPRRRL